VQCVPFGCRVGDFLLEFARRKAAEGCDVIVVSNVADIVMDCRSAGPRLTHLGFMFVEDDILLPGLAPAERASNEAAAPEAVAVALVETKDPDAAGPASPPRCSRPAPPVRRSISKGGGGLPATARRRPPPGSSCPSSRALTGDGRGQTASRQSLVESEDAEEREETLRDSQLDGMALGDDVADTLVDEAEDIFPDTVVDLPYREVEVAYEETFAETLADADARRAAAPGAGLGSQPQQPSADEDVEMAPVQDAQTPVDQLITATPPGDTPPHVLGDRLQEALGEPEQYQGEPEHQSQLPEVQSPSSPEMEVEVDECPASPEPVLAGPSSQPAASECSQTLARAPTPSHAAGGCSPTLARAPSGGGGCSPTLARGPAGGGGCSQTLDLGNHQAPAAAVAPPVPRSAAAADAGAGLVRQATLVVLPETVAGVPTEAATGEAAAGEAAATAAAPAADAAAEAPAREATASGPATAANAAVPADPAAADSSQPRPLEAAAVAPPAAGSETAERSKDGEVECVVVAGSAEATPPAGSLGATLPARPCTPAVEESPLPSSALLGRWVRDGGREHAVVWTPGPAGSFLEFRPTEAKKRALPIVCEGGDWVLNGFHLDNARSSCGFLHWANPSTGAERSWRRLEAGGGGDGPGGAAAAVSVLAGSFAGDACR